MRTTIVFIFLLIAILGHAQTVESIKKYYAEINKQIAASIKSYEGGLYCNEVIVNKYKGSWRAVGNFQEKTMLWYNDDPHFADGSDPLIFLKKVNISSEASSGRYTYEYLYKEGKLVFCYYRDLYKSGNKSMDHDNTYRLYFNEEKIISFSQNGNTVSKLSNEQNEIVEQTLKSSAQNQQLFLSSCGFTSSKEAVEE